MTVRVDIGDRIAFWDEADVSGRSGLLQQLLYGAVVVDEGALNVTPGLRLSFLDGWDGLDR